MESIVKKICSLIVCIVVVASIFTVIPSVKASPKSLYLVPNHHTGQFDAWEIKPDGTAEYQATYWLSYATDPAGIAIDESSNTLFITSEFSGGVEMVDATTMTSLGVSTGPSDLAGIDVDNANDIVYAVKRNSDNLYVYEWDSDAGTLTVRAGFNPFHLPGCSGAFGIALDEIRGILWVADSAAGIVRAYDVETWTEDTSLSFTPSHKPVDVAVDRMRSIVYTVSVSFGASVPGGCGSNLLSKYDLRARTETTVDLGHQGVGVAVDEVTGYVYVTGDYYARKLEVWDTSTTPWTQLQAVSVSGSPAGICIPQEEVAYNPLGLSIDDGLAEEQCVSPEEDITYEICFDNLKNTYDVHNVKIVDELPAEVEFVSATGGGTYDPGTHTVAWDIGTLPAGATQQCVELTVHVHSTVSPGIKPVSAWIFTSSEDILDKSLARFKENADLFGVTSPFAYRFDGTPTLETMYHYEEDSTLLKTLRDKGVTIIPTIRDDYPDLVNPINPGPYLADPEFREAYISAIVSKVEEMGYDGIDIDFETMTKADRPAFSNFMKELSTSLHAKGKMLTTAVMAWTAGPEDAWDWAVLGEVCDKVIIMFYNDEPASTDLVGNVIDSAISVMPKDRVVYAARFNPPGYLQTSLLADHLNIVLAKGIRREIYIWGIWNDNPSLWTVIREKLAPAPAPGSTIVNYVTIDSDETLPTTVSESTDVCPLPDEIGLLVEVTPKKPEERDYYEIDDYIKFEVTVTNPADVTGTDLTAYYVKLSVMEPEEIDIDVPAGGMDIAKILPGESKSTTFYGTAIKAGDNIKVIVNAWGYTDLSDEVGKIRGRGSCTITIHDPDTPKPDWSFAIITDLHIGFNRPDYDGETWDDSGLGEDYDITKYLENAVDKIISERGPYNIKFVVVLGDLADTAEKSEFLKARDILNLLNDPNGDGDTSDGIPYIPVIGDHDQWPYTQPRKNFDPHNRKDHATIADYARGDKFFNDKFWGEENSKNLELIEKLFGIRLGKAEPSFIPGRTQPVYLQNRAFSYGNINFVCLDFNPRTAKPGSWHALFARDHRQTKEFLDNYFKEHEGETVIVLTHHPLYEFGGYLYPQSIEWLVTWHDITMYNFAGHTHCGRIHYQRSAIWSKGYYVIETEPVSQIEFEYPFTDIPICKLTGKSVRIVQIKDNGIDYSTTLKPKEVEIRWPFPDFAYSYASYPVPERAITFTAHFTSYHGFETSFDWDFGDGTYASGLCVTHSYSQDGEYDVTLTVTTKNLATGEEKISVSYTHLTLPTKA